MLTLLFNQGAVVVVPPAPATGYSAGGTSTHPRSGRHFHGARLGAEMERAEYRPPRAVRQSEARAAEARQAAEAARERELEAKRAFQAKWESIAGALDAAEERARLAAELELAKLRSERIRADQAAKGALDRAIRASDSAIRAFEERQREEDDAEALVFLLAMAE